MFKYFKLNNIKKFLQMDTIHDLKSKHKVVIFGGDYCPYCVRVKSLFDKKQIPFEYRDITKK